MDSIWDGTEDEVGSFMMTRTTMPHPPSLPALCFKARPQAFRIEIDYISAAPYDKPKRGKHSTQSKACSSAKVARAHVRVHKPKERRESEGTTTRRPQTNPITCLLLCFHFLLSWTRGPYNQPSIRLTAHTRPYESPSSSDAAVPAPVGTTEL